jgi:hypothetical protein
MIGKMKDPHLKKHPRVAHLAHGLGLLQQEAGYTSKIIAEAVGITVEALRAGFDANPDALVTHCAVGVDGSQVTEVNHCVALIVWGAVSGLTHAEAMRVLDQFYRYLTVRAKGVKPAIGRSRQRTSARERVRVTR